MKLKFIGALALLFALAPGQLSAQGLFVGLGFPRTATATGQTELTGAVMISLQQGTTTAGNLVIDLSPLKITNTNVTDIVVTPAGGLAVGAVTIDTDTSLVRLPVLAGGTSGSIRIEGIRVSVAGTGISTATARLRWEGGLNFFTSGTSVTVISAVQSGLKADPITDRFHIFNGQVVDSTSTITVHEGYASAFFNSTSFGQTVPTRVRIRVTDFPANVQMTFPVFVTDPNTGATLTTVEGSPVVLPRANGNNTVTYSFAGTALSNDTVESFDVPFTVGLTLLGPVGITQPTIEVSLAPIGAAVPDSTFPSTDVPRYAEDEIVVQEGSSRIISQVLYWTGVNSSFQNQVTIFNPTSTVANLTIDALNASGQAVSGTGVINPFKTSLSANQSLARTVSDLFGTVTGIATIRVQSTNPDVLATATVSGSGTTASVPLLSRAVFSAFVPVVNEGAQLHLFNPNSVSTSGTLTLRTAEGSVVTTSNVTLPSLASTSVTIANTFNNPSGGYILGTFSNPVVAFESFGESGKLNELAIQPPAEVASLFIPFFAAGNGFQTDVNLINVSSDIVALTGRIYDGTGTPVGSAAVITMPPNEQLAVSLDRIFSSQIPTTGYVKLDVPLLFKGFFGYSPAISGHARIRTSQGGSTVIPLSAYPLQDAFILGAGTSGSEFEGLALVNPSSTSVSVTLQAMNSTGVALANSTITLNPGQVLSRLVTEFFNTAIPSQSVIRVTATAPIVATSITGSSGLDLLRWLPTLR